MFAARGGTDKFAGNEHRKDTIPICNSLISLGWEAIPVFYRHALIFSFLLDLD